METKIYATEAHQLAFREDLIAVLKKHGDRCTPVELLAVASHLVGQIVAFQDQRKTTAEMAMKIVSENLTLGNQEAVAEVFARTSTERGN